MASASRKSNPAFAQPSQERSVSEFQNTTMCRLWHGLQCQFDRRCRTGCRIDKKQCHIDRCSWSVLRSSFDGCRRILLKSFAGGYCAYPLAKKRATGPAAVGQFGGSTTREMRQHGSLPEHALVVATTTALSFACGAVFPIVVVLIGPGEEIGLYVPLSTMIQLGLLGANGVESGRLNRWLEGFHVTLWGAAAMFATSLVGTTFILVL